MWKGGVTTIATGGYVGGNPKKVATWHEWGGGDGGESQGVCQHGHGIHAYGMYGCMELGSHGILLYMHGVQWARMA